MIDQGAAISLSPPHEASIALRGGQREETISRRRCAPTSDHDQRNARSRSLGLGDHDGRNTHVDALDAGVVVLMLAFLYPLGVHSVFESGSRHHVAASAGMAVLASLLVCRIENLRSEDPDRAMMVPLDIRPAHRTM